MKVLVTGAAGFIGFHVCQRLAQSRKATVLGLDNLNAYYSVELKRARLAELEKCDDCRFVQADFADATAFNGIYNAFKPDYVVHLGAQAGVRYSLENPAAYVHSNLVGFANVLEAVRRHPPKHLLFASSSSVYGTGARVPFREDDVTHQPLSFYAATKQANEVMGYSYSRLYGLNLTGLRFFTVYGPWGRPDMALFLFTKAILEGRPIDVFNHGNMQRDFTYVDDIVEGVIRVLDKNAAVNPEYDAISADPATSNAPYRVFNIGNNNPVQLLDFIGAIEKSLGMTAEKRLLPLQDGDVPATFADVSELTAWTGFKPGTPIAEGVGRFVAWYRAYFKL